MRWAELAVKFDHSPRLRSPPTSSALVCANIPPGKKCFDFSFPFSSSQLEYLSVSLSFSFPLSLLTLLPLQTNVLLFQGSHGSISFQGLHITTSVIWRKNNFLSWLYFQNFSGRILVDFLPPVLLL